jgi:hypothetical protein
MRMNFIETNPIPVKTGLEMMGRFRAHFRLPLCELSERSREPLREALELAGVALPRGDPGRAEDAELDQTAEALAARIAP